MVRHVKKEEERMLRKNMEYRQGRVLKECYRILKNNTKYKNNKRECKKVCNFMEKVH